jgi:GntP family gluconate:H+ symporter
MIADPLWLLAIGMTAVLCSILILRLHAFLALILGALIVAALTSGTMLQNYAISKELSPQLTEKLINQNIGDRIADSFGNTCAGIAILIAMASVIGACLLESGAAEKIIRAAMRLVGEKNAPLAFLGSGFVLGAPVYFDTVFYLMIPLGKAMCIHSGKNFILITLSIVAGATMAHSLVPPTPGPLLVAGELKVDTGLMIMGGTLVGCVTIFFGYLYALMANYLWNIPLRDTTDISTEKLQATAQKSESDLPPLWLAILPIVLPVFLIAGNTILKTLLNKVEESAVSIQYLLSTFSQLGDKNIALTISAGIALVTVIWQLNLKKEDMLKVISNALSSAGQIILITAAGGTFGAMLQQTGIGPRIQELAQNNDINNIAVLPLAFGVTTLVRTAQGSATVAMITAVGILSGMADPEVLGFHPVYLALAIGCGSKPIMWMNDSGFWIIGRMSGMTEGETLKTVSVMLIVMSLAGLGFIMLLAHFFPMV